MLGRTHIAVGAASALLVVQPTTPASCLVTCAAGALGGLVCDLDTPSSMANKELRAAWALLAAGLCLAVVADVCLGVGALDYLWASVRATIEAARGSRVALGVALVGLVCALGSRTAHRSFLHSLLALTLVGYGLQLACPPLALPVAAGFASHVTIDLLNRRSVRVLWPLKRGFALGVASSDGMLNNVLGVMGLVASCGWIAHVAGLF